MLLESGIFNNLFQIFAIFRQSDMLCLSLEDGIVCPKEDCLLISELVSGNSKKRDTCHEADPGVLNGWNNTGKHIDGMRSVVPTEASSNDV